VCQPDQPSGITVAQHQASGPHQTSGISVAQQLIKAQYENRVLKDQHHIKKIKIISFLKFFF